MSQPEIIEWIKQNKLWFVVGYRLTHQEFDAEIWTHTNRNGRIISVGWWGAGATMEEALRVAYEKAKDLKYNGQEIKRIYRENFK